jgi:hypothetical protein
VSDTLQDRLHQAVWAFHAAVQLRDGVEARLRRGEIDEDLYYRSLTSAEAVVAARVALYRLLMEEGWTPPPSVVQDLVLDDTLLHERAEHHL